MPKSVVLLLLALPLFAQVKKVDARETGLRQQARTEPDAAHRIELLLKWESDFPGGEFQWERLQLLIAAYRQAGLVEKGFDRSVEAFQLARNRLDAARMIVILAPSLTNPSREQIRMTAEAAQRLLTLFAPEPEQPTSGKAAATDSDVALIREWRKDKTLGPRSDSQIENIDMAEKALAWAKGVSNAP